MRRFNEDHLTKPQYVNFTYKTLKSKPLQAQRMTNMIRTLFLKYGTISEGTSVYLEHIKALQAVYTTPYCVVEEYKVDTVPSETMINFISACKDIDPTKLGPWCYSSTWIFAFAIYWL